jgi:hypothetical protein
MPKGKGIGDMVIGAIPGLVISIVTTVIVFSGTFSGLSTRVDANTDKLKNVVYQNEFKAVIDGQKEMADAMNKRLDRMEEKLDRINERIK